VNRGAAVVLVGLLPLAAVACENGHTVTVENPCSVSVGVAVQNVHPTGPLDALGSREIPPHGEGTVELLGPSAHVHFLVIQTGPLKGEVIEQDTPDDRLTIPSRACATG
jgi:hypothetical protein